MFAFTEIYSLNQISAIKLSQCETYTCHPDVNEYSFCLFKSLSNVKSIIFGMKSTNDETSSKLKFGYFVT